MLLPAENKKDLTDIPKEALKELHISFVTDMQQVIDKVLLAPPPDGRKRDKDRLEEEKDEASETVAEK